MRIKRFQAKNSSTALAMIKAEMGDDAVILATKEIAGSHGKKSTVEVVAAIDYDLEELNIPAFRPDDSDENIKPSVKDSYDYRTIRRQPVKSEAPCGRQSKSGSVKKGPVTEIQSEAQDLRLRFSNILRLPRAEKGQEDPKVFPAAREKTSPPKHVKPDPENVAAWRDQLINKISFRQFTPMTATGSGASIALVGATGVGKTTTAAKIAAWYSLRQGLKVCLLSMDCYRIGATDQLRTYARIMRLPCEVVLRKADLRKALHRHRDKIIIIDTAGKSPYDEQHISELQEWFEPFPEIDPHLVLNATTKKEDLQHVIKVYSPLNIGSMILTKLDETRAYAALCHQVVASRLPISYLCTGQRVPEDFQIASKDFLDTLFKGGEMI